MKRILLALSFIGLLFGCSSKDRTVNSSEIEHDVLVATNQGSPAVQLVNLADGTVKSSDFFRQSNGNNLESPVTKMFQFRENIFLMQPGSKQITVVNQVSFKQQTVFSTSSFGAPLGITFPNATDAYVITDSSSMVLIFDLTTLRFATSIQLDGLPRAVESYGNRVVIALDNGNEDIIGTNTRSVLARCVVAPNPVSVGFTGDGGYAAIISAGAGKTGSDNGDKTPAQVSFIDMASMSVQSILDLSVGALNAVNVLPTGFVVSVSDWGFVTTTESLMRVDMRSKNTVALIVNFPYEMPLYDPGLGNLTLLRQNTDGYSLIKAEPRLGKILNEIKLPAGVTSYLIYN